MIKSIEQRKARRSTGRKPPRGRPANALFAEERRERLMTAALTVMARDGLAASSTRSIAAEAGMNQAMLHYSFDGKEALLKAVLDKLHGEIQQFLVQAVQGAPHLHAAVAQLAAAYWQQVQATPELQRVQYELTLCALNTPGLQALAQQQYQGYVDVLCTALKALPAPANAAPLPVLAGLCVASMDGLILQYLATRDHAACELRLQAMVAAMQSQCGTAP